MIAENAEIPESCLNSASVPMMETCVHQLESVPLAVVFDEHQLDSDDQNVQTKRLGEDYRREAVTCEY